MNIKIFNLDHHKQTLCALVFIFAAFSYARRTTVSGDTGLWCALQPSSCSFSSWTIAPSSVRINFIASKFNAQTPRINACLIVCSIWLDLASVSASFLFAISNCFLNASASWSISWFCVALPKPSLLMEAACANAYDDSFALLSFSALAIFAFFLNVQNDLRNTMFSRILFPGSFASLVFSLHTLNNDLGRFDKLHSPHKL